MNLKRLVDLKNKKNMSKEGKPIEYFDPKPAIKKNAELARDWEYSEEAQFLYGMAVLFKDRLLDPVLHTDRGRLPDPVISFDDLRNKKTLAAYSLHRNPQGLLDEITFNIVHYKKEEGKMEWVWGKWAQLETLLHEQVHLWQQNFGNNPVKPGRVHHNKEFVEKCQSLGLHPQPGVGAHIKVADGVFAHLMNELGIPRPDDVPTLDWTKAGGKPRKRDWFRPTPEKGRSTLHKWTCPDCRMSVRVGIKDDPRLVHDVCSEKRGEKVFLVKHDGLQHILYDRGADDEGTPSIIDEVNNRLRECVAEKSDALTVEGIAKRVGISRNILYQWMKADMELSETLERLNKIQEDDPFKTGTDEDSQVNATMIAVVLMKTRDRHYNPDTN